MKEKFRHYKCFGCPIFCECKITCACSAFPERCLIKFLPSTKLEKKIYNSIMCKWKLVKDDFKNKQNKKD